MVVLKEKNGERYLPIWIGFRESIKPVTSQEMEGLSAFRETIDNLDLEDFGQKDELGGPR